MGGRRKSGRGWQFEGHVEAVPQKPLEIYRNDGPVPPLLPPPLGRDDGTGFRQELDPLRLSRKLELPAQGRVRPEDVESRRHGDGLGVRVHDGRRGRRCGGAAARGPQFREVGGEGGGDGPERARSGPALDGGGVRGGGGRIGGGRNGGRRHGGPETRLTKGFVDILNMLCVLRSGFCGSDLFFTRGIKMGMCRIFDCISSCYDTYIEVCGRTLLINLPKSFPVQSVRFLSS